MNRKAISTLLGCAVFISGCATRRDFADPATMYRPNNLSAETKTKILAIDPEHVTEKEIREVLGSAPAPRIINIHGGPLPIKARMNSFSEFLIGMGYPEASIRNPANGSFTYGYYHSSERLAGTIAWYYEQDGLRPMIVGHSLGGFQAVRILHKLAGDSTKTLQVWSPLTQAEEDRCDIVDPLTGTTRPVVGLQISYAAAVVSGGMGRVLPNEWDINSKLRLIPDSVEEFTGFQKGLDLMGGDYLGYGSANDYHATGTAVVRNVRLPSLNPHFSIPDTKNLIKNEEIREWINNYQPGNQEVDAPGSNPAQVLWAAEVWHGIKKHWVIELQRLISARSAHKNGG